MPSANVYVNHARDIAQHMHEGLQPLKLLVERRKTAEQPYDPPAVKEATLALRRSNNIDSCERTDAQVEALRYKGFLPIEQSG